MPASRGARDRRLGGLGGSGGLGIGVGGVLESVALAGDGDGGGAVEETVEGGGGHDGVAGEDAARSAKALLEVMIVAACFS